MQSVNLPKAVKVVLIVRLEGVTKQDGDVELCEAKVRVVQLCLTLYNPMDYTVHGILQATILEVGSLSPSPGDLSNPGIKPRSPALQADSLPAEPQGKPKGS